VQERFVASTEGAAAPAPLAIRPLARDTRSLLYGAFGVVATLAGIGLLRIGFGDLSSRFALAPTAFVALYSGCFALAAAGFFMAAVRHVKAYAVPYHPALYLYPIGVIDARSPEFVVHRITEDTQARFDPARSALRVESEGAHFEFPAADPGQAEQAAAAVLALRDRLANSGPESSAREQSLVDPLIDNGFKNPFAPAEPLRKELPGWIKHWPWMALLLGVLLGGAAFLVRNHLSEGRLYAAARKADTSAAYRTYLERGGRNPDVRALLLPRGAARRQPGGQRRRHRALSRRKPQYANQDRSRSRAAASTAQRPEPGRGRGHTDCAQRVREQVRALLVSDTEYRARDQCAHRHCTAPIEASARAQPSATLTVHGAATALHRHARSAALGPLPTKTHRNPGRRRKSTASKPLLQW